MPISERVAVVLDLENLLGGRLDETALDAVVELMRTLRSRRRIVSSVGYCARGLQRRVAFDLAPVGVRVFGHSEHVPDAADRLVLRHLDLELPATATTVVIG